MREIRNATIDSVRIEFERGILTAWVYLRWKGGGQGFGGYALGFDDSDRAPDKQRPASGHMEAFIKGVLIAVGVDRWEDLKGCSCRIDHEHSKVHRIGHYLDDEKWFDPKAVFDEMAKVPAPGAAHIANPRNA